MYMYRPFIAFCGRSFVQQVYIHFEEVISTKLWEVHTFQPLLPVSFGRRRRRTRRQQQQISRKLFTTRRRKDNGRTNACWHLVRRIIGGSLCRFHAFRHAWILMPMVHARTLNDGNPDLFAWRLSFAAGLSGPYATICTTGSDSSLHTTHWIQAVMIHIPRRRGI